MRFLHRFFTGLAAATVITIPVTFWHREVQPLEGFAIAAVFALLAIAWRPKE